MLASTGMSIFRDTFDSFKNRLRKNQAQKSAWKVTRWAIHDGPRFEVMIGRLKDFVDGLESVTTSLGLLAQQQARLREEIDSVSDVQSLQLLRDSSSNSLRGSSAQQDVSDTASRRLTFVIAASILEREEIRTEVDTENLISSGNVYQEPNSDNQQRHESRHDSPTNEARAKASKQHHQKIPSKGLSRPVALDIRPKVLSTCVPLDSIINHLYTTQEHQSIDRVDVPQNQRLISEVVKRNKGPKPLSFAAGDHQYGKALSKSKKADDRFCLQHSADMFTKACLGTSAAKRMFIELRNIRQGLVPFISAVPVDDSLNKILASIEGPPGTPYEGGVFWITVKVPQTPFGPPLMRFQTPIYHPNISCRGNICAGYQERWNSVLSTGHPKAKAKDPVSLWYHGKSADKWSLGALLVAICGLLASPVVNDPLVPEIATTYLEDYDTYCDAARLYTQRYAQSGRPDDRALIFMDEAEQNNGLWTAPEANPDALNRLREERLRQKQAQILQRHNSESYFDDLETTYSSRSASQTETPTTNDVDLASFDLIVSVLQHSELSKDAEIFIHTNTKLTSIATDLAKWLYEMTAKHPGATTATTIMAQDFRQLVDQLISTETLAINLTKFWDDSTLDELRQSGISLVLNLIKLLGNCARLAHREVKFHSYGEAFVQAMFSASMEKAQTLNLIDRARLWIAQFEAYYKSNLTTRKMAISRTTVPLSSNVVYQWPRSIDSLFPSASSEEVKKPSIPPPSQLELPPLSSLPAVICRSRSMFRSLSRWHTLKLQAGADNSSSGRIPRIW